MWLASTSKFTLYLIAGKADVFPNLAVIKKKTVAHLEVLLLTSMCSSFQLIGEYYRVVLNSVYFNLTDVRVKMAIGRSVSGVDSFEDVEHSMKQ